MDFNGSSPLRRALGPMDATCVVIGAIIGVGIFFTPSRVAALAGCGSIALLAWGVGGAIALCGALTFAELGARYPHAGGQYEILRDAYGPFLAFLFVFCNATATQAGAIAIIALLCAQNMVLAVGGQALDTPWLMMLASLLIVSVTIANAMGVRWGASIQNVTVIAKLLTLLLIAALAMSSPDADSATVDHHPVIAPIALVPDGPDEAETSRGFGARELSFGGLLMLFAAIVPSFFAYGGWQHALWIAGEVRHPQRNLPLSIIGGVVVVVFVYLLTNWSFLRLMGYDAVRDSQALAADAVARVWPAWGGRATAGAVAVSAFGVLNAQLLSGPRLIYRMSVDGRFFSWFGKVSARHATPAAAILLLGAMGLTLLLLAGCFSARAIDAIDRLTTGAVFIDGVFFVLTAVSLFILRRRDAAVNGIATTHVIGTGGANPGATDPLDLDARYAPLRRFRLGYPVVPAIFALGEIGIIIGAYTAPGTRGAVLIGLGWIIGAALLYFFLFRRPRQLL